MNKEEFMDYLVEDYNIGGATLKLIGNILQYVKDEVEEDEEGFALWAMLRNTIGLTDDEINKIQL